MRRRESERACARVAARPVGAESLRETASQLSCERATESEWRVSGWARG